MQISVHSAFLCSMKRWKRLNAGSGLYGGCIDTCNLLANKKNKQQHTLFLMSHIATSAWSIFMFDVRGDVIQMMHGNKYNIQICCPEVDMSSRGRSPSDDISTEGQHIWMFHEQACFICFVVWPTKSKYKIQGPYAWHGLKHYTSLRLKSTYAWLATIGRHAWLRLSAKPRLKSWRSLVHLPTRRKCAMPGVSEWLSM